MTQRRLNRADRKWQWPGVALVGCGNWGHNLARNFHAHGVLAVVCDSHADRAASFAAEFGVRAARFDELLGDDLVEAVALATPSGTHYALAREALTAAKHVFVEKPMALDPGHAGELNDIAACRGLTLMVGHLMHYHPAFVRLADMARHGELGDVHYISAERLGPIGAPDEPCVVPDLAPHDISMVLSLFSELPYEVAAFGDRSGASGGSKAALAALEYSDGRIAHLRLSWLHPTKQRSVTVVGSEATAVFDDGNDWSQKLVVYRPGAHGFVGTPVSLTPVEPLAIECQHFLDCIVSGRQPRTSGCEGHAVLRVLHAIEHSIVKRRPVLIATTDETGTDCAEKKAG